MQSLKTKQSATRGAVRSSASSAVVRPAPIAICTPRNTAQCSLAPCCTSSSPAPWIVRSSKLGEVPLFADSSLLGGPAMVEEKSNKVKLEDVPLESEVSSSSYFRR